MSNDDEIPSPYGPGPFETYPEREKLDARIVRSKGGCVEVHGYDLADDLSRHYSFTELILTSLLGAPPDEPTGQLFELCCQMAAPVSVAEAPAHAGRIAETIGTNAAGTVSSVATGLAEQVRYQFERLQEFRAWLDDPEGPAPPVAEAPDESLEGMDHAFYRRLQELPVTVEPFSEKWSFWAMLIAGLHACGLRDARRVMAALVTARLPIAAAEGLIEETGRLANYPMNIPPLDYRHEEARDD